MSRRRWSGSLVLLQFNRFAIATGIASLAIVAIYPFMKRITYWPQIVLGLAFSWGALMGWAVIARPDRCAGASALRRLDRLGDRLRHDLCASGHRGRRADRHQIDRAACSARARAGARGVLWLGGGADRRALALAGARWPAWIGLAAFAAHLVWQIVRLDIAIPRCACGVQVQPRRGADAVRGTAGRRGDAVRAGWTKPRERAPEAVPTMSRSEQCCRAIGGHASLCPPTASLVSIPGDDLALAVVDVRRIEQIAAAAADQEFRTPGPDRVMAPPPRAGSVALSSVNGGSAKMSHHICQAARSHRGRR